MLTVAPKNNVKYYLNAVHVEHRGDKCVIEATDEAMALRVSVPTYFFKGVLSGVGDQILIRRESLEQAVEEGDNPNGMLRINSRVLFRGRNLDLMEGNFPFLDTAKPRPDGTHSVHVDTDRLMVLLGAISLLRKDCKRNVSRLGVGGNVGLAGFVDDVDYVAFLAPASR
jgi:hypothetical protein